MGLGDCIISLMGRMTKPIYKRPGRYTKPSNSKAKIREEKLAAAEAEEEALAEKERRSKVCAAAEDGKVKVGDGPCIGTDIEKERGVEINEEFARRQSNPIVLNDVELVPIPGVRYPSNYWEAIRLIQSKEVEQHVVLRELCKEDLWFLLFFILKIPVMNSVFGVNVCKEIREGPKTDTVDIWAREHLKSTCFTIGENIQDILKDKEATTCIFSYAKRPAEAFLGSIKSVFEQNIILKLLFSDVLYLDPAKESPCWKADAIVCKRESYVKEATVEAWGLIEGMPVGRHFSKLIYDDVVTADLVDSPDIIQKVKNRFDMSLNVGSDGCRVRIIGTFYAHDDPLVYITNLKDEDGVPIYHTRIKPATDNGLANGKPVFLSESRFRKLKAGNLYQFNCQQLCNPTPVGEQKLDSNLLIRVPADKVPKNLFKFMLIDQAGDGRKDGRPGDWWAICVFGVVPNRDEQGASDVYWLDAGGGPVGEVKAKEEVVKIYTRNGRIVCLGVEKVGLATTEVHIANALRARGRVVSIESGTLKVLNPMGMSKVRRIESQLGWPLHNGKMRISSNVPELFVQRLIEEMNKFPYWHDDILDAWSYLYFLIKDYRFGPVVQEEEHKPDLWEQIRQRSNRLSTDNWMTV